MFKCSSLFCFIIQFLVEAMVQHPNDQHLHDQMPQKLEQKDRHLLDQHQHDREPLTTLNFLQKVQSLTNFNFLRRINFLFCFQYRNRFEVGLQHWLLISERHATCILMWRFWDSIGIWPIAVQAIQNFLVFWIPSPHFSTLLITFGTKPLVKVARTGI